MAEMTATAIARETGETIVDARKRIWLVDSQVFVISTLAMRANCFCVGARSGRESGMHSHRKHSITQVLEAAYVCTVLNARVRGCPCIACTKGLMCVACGSQGLVVRGRGDTDTLDDHKLLWAREGPVHDDIQARVATSLLAVRQ